MNWLLARVPIIALAYVQIIQPVIDRLLPGVLNPQIVWPALFGLTAVLVLYCRRDMNFKVLLRPPGLLLIIFLLFAGLSIVWSYSPVDAIKRWFQAAILAAVVIVPFALKKFDVDILSAAFWCSLLAITVNIIFILTTPPMLEWTGEVLGHTGYFLHKQYLGFCASIAILLAIYSLSVGQRRLASIALLAAAFWVILNSQSKTAVGFLSIALAIALLVFFASRKSRRPMVVFVAALPITFMSLSLVFSNLANRISFRIYGDPTFTGRTFIWDFIETQTALKPWLGWGFHSFFFVPNSPIYSAPGFVSSMPSSHSGYLELRLETGYIGLAIFLAFIVATLYALEDVRRVDPRRALALLTLFIYVMMLNLMETIWFIPFDPQWLLFLVITGETMRYAEATSNAPRPNSAPARVHFFSQSFVLPIGPR